ncbi:MAG: hypothetical protein JAY75_08190 [Candidatus Thiodiazotropha taylori]|nr:hypothetical protein [Candidatus Thiodiazotropha taylori]MCG8094906.1 hypothetical protein [Candidatus Thiodiazotropha endolucinida]MCG7884570.1 hypothetical protein [Candidatus Thiodiazotropha taylori]MCG7889032.1 hypothetical protein [Candidatus Thiodiazotropha taylori]MCG7950993.1 hypothetical protein [Candidatus Thiodiazotropha taylori]
MQNIQNLVFTANFLRLTPGSEISSARQIESNTDSDLCHVFKFLGSYDLLRVELGDSLIQRDSETDVDGILEMSSIKATALPSALTSDINEFYSNFKQICSYPIVALIFLQLPPKDGYAARLEKQEEILREAEEYINKNNVSSNICGFLSYGKNDTVIFVGTEEFVSVFEILRHLRREHSEELLDTTTYTAVSLGLVSDRERLLSTLTEKVSVDIQISCEPGSEPDIVSSFSSAKFDFGNILGKDDIRVTSKGSIPAGEAIAAVLDSRDQGKKSNRLLATNTYIGSSVNSEQAESTGTAEQIHGFIKEERRVKIRDDANSALSILSELHQSNKIDSYFIHQCREALIDLRSLVSIDSSYQLIADFDKCIEFELIEILNELLREVRHGEGILITEKSFQFLTIHLSNAIAQRTLNLHDFRHGLPDVPQDYGQGVFLTSVAISTLVRQIYEIMETTRVGTGEWAGFIIFSQFLGFKCFTSTVFSLPSNVLSSVLTPSLNWLTLSHEIAHDIWAEEDVYNTPRAWVYGNANVSFRDIVEGKASDMEGLTPPDNKFAVDAEPMLGEWYAHWFDFRHFYSSDFEFFAWSIWCSWLRLPLVKNNLGEYFARTLAVYVASRLSEFTDEHLSKEETLQLTATMFDDLLASMKDISPVNYNDEYGTIISSEKSDIVKVVGANIGFIDEFERSCYRGDFATLMKKAVQSASNDIPNLIEGTPLKNHPNAFALLIAAMSWIRNGDAMPTHKFELSFLLSCLFAATNYENRNTS